MILMVESGSAVNFYSLPLVMWFCRTNSAALASDEVIVSRHLSLLRIPLPGCAPEARFFMVRLLKQYGSQDEFTGGIKEFAASFGVREELISGVFRELVQNGYLKERRVGGRRGRPSRYFGWGTTIGLLGEKVIRHVPLIEELLAVELRGRLKNERLKLTLSNRLLLAVLLAHSDSSGVVTGLGLAGLSALTGLNRDQLFYQLRKLEYAGYLRPFVSGITGTGLFGASPGHHFVNLKHPGFGSVRRRGVLLVYSEADTIAWIDTEAHSIGALAQHLNGFPNPGAQGALSRVDIASKYIPCDANFLEFAKLLVGPLKTRHGEEFLQAKLNRYASYILNNHWHDLEDGAKKVDKARLTKEPLAAFHSPKLTDLINQDCFGFKAQEVGPPTREMGMLITFLREAALWVAVKAWRCMNKSKTWWRDTECGLEIPFEDMEHVIFACKGVRGPLGLSIDSYYKSGENESSKCLYINGAAGRTHVIEDEFKLEDMRRCRYGLLGVSKKYPTATSHERNRGPDHENYSSERGDALHGAVTVNDL